MAKENEISLTRVYDAPVKLVWEAWTDPKKAAKWWGPRGFTITTHSKDLRPGGIWHYTMHGPDGTDYPNKTLYHEVVEHQRLVYDHGGNDEQKPLFKVTVTFTEVKGKTVMAMIMAFESAEVRKQMGAFIKKAGGNGTWDRLAEYLGDEAGKNKFIINRSFETDVATMYKMWTDPKHLEKWMPPTGLTMECTRADVKVGGAVVFKMTDGKDMTMFGRLQYRDLIPDKRIMYVQEFLDNKGNLSRHPMLQVFPSAMLVIIELNEEGPKQTRVTVSMEPTGAFNKEEAEAFTGQRGNMTIGWTGSFDKLEEII
ncbi:MAG: SRPBCC family protein [Bdellovibrionota bacterium]